LWMVTAYVIYKIPVADPTSPDTSSSNGPSYPSSLDEPQV
jgi:hypothetical protein